MGARRAAGRKRRAGVLAVALVLAALASATTAGGAAHAAAFQRQTVFSGLTRPVSVVFARGPRVFVAESAGVIKVFDSITDTTPTVFADLRSEVYGYNGHGLLGIALDPQFPSHPYVYALFSRDSTSPGGAVPAWNDTCPIATAPTDGCMTFGRLERLTALGDHMTGSPLVLVDDWCAQFVGHSVDTLRFGPDGYLYASAGDGADYQPIDYGQHGSPTTNPCNDPPGGTLTPPTSEGGSLRAQDVRSNGDPAGLDGTIIRIDPSTGAAAPTNKLATSPDVNKRRVLAFGLRNVFRFTFRPGTNELWMADNGASNWDEIDRVADVTAGGGINFGWPCYEGSSPQPTWQSTGFNLCASLYSSGHPQMPSFQYAHGAPVYSGDPCVASGGSPTGISFYNGTSYPAQYRGALFFADYIRQCIYVAPAGANGQPKFAATQLFMNLAPASITDLEAGPGGDLFYVDNAAGTVVRIVYS